MKGGTSSTILIGMMSIILGSVTPGYAAQPDSPIERLVRIECETSIGAKTLSGCIVHMEDNTYILARQSSLLGSTYISFTTLSGETLTPTGVDLAHDRDLARLLLDEDHQGYNVVDSMTMNEPVKVIAFARTPSKTDEMRGTILGIGGNVVEVSARFNESQKGAPVLNEDGEILGLTATILEPHKNVASAGTSFGDETRHLCCRIGNAEWESVDWRNYNKTVGAYYHDIVSFTDQAGEIMMRLRDAPVSRCKVDAVLMPELLQWETYFNDTVLKMSRTAPGDVKDFRDAYEKHLKRLKKECEARREKAEAFLRSYNSDGFIREDMEQLALTLGQIIGGLNQLGY